MERKGEQRAHVHVSSCAQSLSRSSHAPAQARPASAQYAAQLRPRMPEATKRVQGSPQTSPVSAWQTPPPPPPGVLKGQAESCATAAESRIWT